MNGVNVTYFDSFNYSDHTKCIFPNNQPGMTRPTLIDLNPDEYNQGLCYYPFVVNLDRCNGSYLKGRNFRDKKFLRKKFSRIDGRKIATFAEEIFAS